MRLLLFVALLALPGCAGTPDNPAEAACRRKAYSDPAVKEAIMRANSPLQEVRVLWVQAQKDAIARATQRCLAANGLAPLGGVEPVQNR